MNNTVGKIIGEHEKEFLGYVKDTGITTDFTVAPFSEQGKYIITMERWPYSLRNYLRTNTLSPELEKSITDKIDALHSLGILHSDLHKKNIVTDGIEARLIDFEYARFIKDMDSEHLKQLGNFWWEPREQDMKPLETLGEAIHYERNVMWRT